MIERSTIEERLRTALREAALQVTTGPPAVTTLHRPARRRSARLLAALAAALVVVAFAVAGAVILVDRGPAAHSPTSSGGRPRELPPSKLLPAEADITVFMKTALSYPAQQAASPEQIAAVQRAIRHSGDVRSYTFVDSDATYREFRKAFHDQPDLVNSVDRAALPVSFRIVLDRCDAQTGLINELGGQPGVDQAVAGRGLSHAAAKRAGYQRTQPSTLQDSHCGYHQPRGAPLANLTITALPSLAYQATQYTVPSGIIEITLTSAGGTHTLAFDDPQFRGFQLIVPTGPIRGKVRLKPGTYVIACSIPGHREAGEQATIIAT